MQKNFRIIDLVLKCFIFFAMATILFVIGSIFYFVVSNGIKEVSFQFLLENPKGMPLGSEGGIKDAIFGSLFLMIVAIALSVILGISCALYNTIYCKSKTVKLIINLIVQCVASIPSIIIGLFVYGFFIVTLNIPKSMLTAGIALGIMIFAFIEIRVEKVILSLDKKIIRDSYSLGVESDYMSRKLILPTLKNEITAIAILGGSHAFGATAPILLTGAVFIGGSSNELLRPVKALPYHLHMLLGQGGLNEKAYATAFVLIVILLLLHILAELVAIGIGGKIIGYIRTKRR